MNKVILIATMVGVMNAPLSAADDPYKDIPQFVLDRMSHRHQLESTVSNLHGLELEARAASLHEDARRKAESRHPYAYDTFMIAASAYRLAGNSSAGIDVLNDTLSVADTDTKRFFVHYRLSECYLDKSDLVNADVSLTRCENALLALSTFSSLQSSVIRLRANYYSVSGQHKNAIAHRSQLLSQEIVDLIDPDTLLFAVAENTRDRISLNDCIRGVVELYTLSVSAQRHAIANGDFVYLLLNAMACGRDYKLIDPIFLPVILGLLHTDIASYPEVAILCQAIVQIAIQNKDAGLAVDMARELLRIYDKMQNVWLLLCPVRSQGAASAVRVASIQATYAVKSLLQWDDVLLLASDALSVLSDPADLEHFERLHDLAVEELE